MDETIRKGVAKTRPREVVKEAGSKKDDWDQSLVRFRAQFNHLYSVQNGKPSGGLVLEMVSQTLTNFMKEDLKRSISGFCCCVLVHHSTNLAIWQ